MEDQLSGFKALLDKASTVLITSHTSPDPDAVCSLLLLTETLKTNYEDKSIIAALEELPKSMSYLKGFGQIRNGRLPTILEELKPDLLILVDAVNYDRASRQDGEDIRRWLASHPDTKTAIIDHHEDADKDSADFYFNRRSPAATQDIYKICYTWLNLKPYIGYADTALLGIYADTGGFVYNNSHYRETFDVVCDLVDAGGSLEKARFRLESYTTANIHVIGELAANLTAGSDYTYSFLSDEFVAGWSKDEKPLQDLHLGCKIFVDNFIRNIDGRQWGFIVYRDLLEKDLTYAVSLRSVAGVKDVSALASRLGGGGHKPAAGGRFEAAGIREAVAKIQAVINGADDED